MQSNLAAVRVPTLSMQEKLAVANLTLHSLADIDENLRESLEYIKQETTMEFEIEMSTGEKTLKKLSARQNMIARFLWKTKTNACIDETFIQDSV